MGQQQRVALARALANRPRLVLADEPTGSLDPFHAADSMRLIRKLCDEHGATLLLVSHDRNILEQFEHVVDFSELNRADFSPGGGRVGKAAKLLGIHRKTLLQKRKRYGLD